MSKQTTTPKTYGVKSIIIALLPYFVIWTMVVGLSGVITGWVARSDDNGRIQTAANQLVEDLAKELKQ